MQHVNAVCSVALWRNSTPCTFIVYATFERNVMPAHEEIERTWLMNMTKVRGYIDLNAVPGDAIEQGYITPTTLEDPLRTTYRLRKRADAYYFTWKHGGTTVRMEYEVQLTKEQFQAMWGMVGKQFLKKTRYKLHFHDDRNPHMMEGWWLELDVFAGDHAGLVLAEVEFCSEEDAKKFVAPPWFGIDVTEDSRYSNYSLAINGLPENE